MRLPLAELGANAFVSLAVEYTLLRRPSEVRAALAAEAGGAPPPMNEVSVYLSAHGIIATRGAATDSFARLMLVTRGETEWEMGRTEVVQDELTPCFRKTLRFSYSATSLEDPECLVRLELCDPLPAKDSDELFTVIGIVMMMPSFAQCKDYVRSKNFMGADVAPRATLRVITHHEEKLANEEVALSALS